MSTPDGTSTRMTALRWEMFRKLRQRGWSCRSAGLYAVRNRRSFVALRDAVRERRRAA